MDFWIKASQLILSLSILVILHELGHYIPARLFKTRVEKFYLFFDPWFSLFKKKIGDTEWGIGWLPLGGYVKIAGMVDESMDKEQLAQPPQPWEFRSKKAWQRLIIMIGGVTVNLILGVLIYILVVFSWGEYKLHPKDLKAGMSVHPYLKKYGLESGDNILKINGEELDNINDATFKIWLFDGRKLEVKKAGGSIKHITLPENIDYELFEKGALPVIGGRSYAGKVDKLASVDQYDFHSQRIKPNDMLEKINGEKITSIEDYNQVISPDKPNTLSIRRDSTLIEVKVMKKELPHFYRLFPGIKIGLKPGDNIVEINSKPIRYFDDVVTALYESKGKAAEIKVLRNDSTISLNGKIPQAGKLGFVSEKLRNLDKAKHISYSFAESIGVGLSKGVFTLRMYAGQLKFLFTEKGASSIGGFGSIGKMFPPTWDWEVFWLTTAFISIVLAFMNILPIPALDGGHVVFLLYEMITGKEAPQKVLEYAQYVGFILLLGLLLYANGNDIYSHFFK